MKAASQKKRRDSAETAEFGDENVIRALCGPYDRHLALIEEACDVHIAAPGGAMIFTGAASDRVMARAVVQSLYDRLKRGDTCTEADVRASLRLHRGRGGAPRPGPGRIQVSPRVGVEARTEAQLAYFEALSDHDLVFGVGAAGTGKTFLAVAHGVARLLSGRVERLVIARPAVEAGERLGFLPGDMTEKVDPYLAPIWDALRGLIGKEQLDKRRAAGEIEVAPLAFMRGRTLSNAYVIVDEAQNATVMQMKMVLTRIGEGAAMAVTGDPSQVDLPTRERSGLAHAVRILDGARGVKIIRFGAADVVRHPLVAEILERYEHDAAAEPSETGPQP
ncbi:MAG: PhoH family protein [Maricaulaceae bacterium]